MILHDPFPPVEPDVGIEAVLTVEVDTRRRIPLLEIIPLVGRRHAQLVDFRKVERLVLVDGHTVLRIKLLDDGQGRRHTTAYGIDVHPGVEQRHTSLLEHCPGAAAATGTSPYNLVVPPFAHCLANAQLGLSRLGDFERGVIVIEELVPCTFGAFDRLLRGICRQSPLAGIVFGIEEQHAVVIPEIGEIAVAVEERTGRQQQHLRLNRPVDRLGDASQLGLPVGYHGGQARVTFVEQADDILHAIVERLALHLHRLGRCRHRQVFVDDRDRAVRAQQIVMIIGFQELGLGDPACTLVHRQIGHLRGILDVFEECIAVTDPHEQRKGIIATLPPVRLRPVGTAHALGDIIPGGRRHVVRHIQPYLIAGRHADIARRLAGARQVRVTRKQVFLRLHRIRKGMVDDGDIVGYDIQEAVARCGQQSAACEPASDLYFPPNGKLVFFHSSLSFKFPFIIR